MTDNPTESDLKFFIDDSFPKKLSLDFSNYAKTLSELILSSFPKYTIGIYGSWGTGKTTLMNKMKNRLDGEFLCIDFNAWRFASEPRHATFPLMLTIINYLLDNSNVEAKIEDKGWKNRIGRVVRGLSGNVSVGLPGIAGFGLTIDPNNMTPENIAKATVSELRDGVNLFC